MPSTYDPDWLVKAMEAHGIQTGELAEVTGVSRSQIQRIRNGMTPRVRTMVALTTGIEQLRPKPVRRARSSQVAA